MMQNWLTPQWFSELFRTAHTLRENNVFSYPPLIGDRCVLNRSVHVWWRPNFTGLWSFFPFHFQPTHSFSCLNYDLEMCRQGLAIFSWMNIFGGTWTHIGGDMFILPNVVFSFMFTWLKSTRDKKKNACKCKCNTPLSLPLSLAHLITFSNDLLLRPPFKVTSRSQLLTVGRQRLGCLFSMTVTSATIHRLWPCVQYAWCNQNPQRTTAWVNTILTQLSDLLSMHLPNRFIGPCSIH